MSIAYTHNLDCFCRQPPYYNKTIKYIRYFFYLFSDVKSALWFLFHFQSVIQMSGFRSLGDDEEVEFECQVSDKGLEATRVTGPQSTDCKGSHRRPASKKRFRKIRYLIVHIFLSGKKLSIFDLL